jgi:hypothetical protein
MPHQAIISNRQGMTDDNVYEAVHTISILVPVGLVGTAATQYMERKVAILSVGVPGVAFPAICIIPAIGSYRSGHSSKSLMLKRVAAAIAEIIGSSLILAGIDNDNIVTEIGIWFYAVGASATWLLELDRAQGCLQNSFNFLNAINEFISIGVLGSTIDKIIPTALALLLSALPNLLCGLLILFMVGMSAYDSLPGSATTSLKLVQSLLAMMGVVGAMLMLTDLNNQSIRPSIGVWAIASGIGAIRALPMPGSRYAEDQDYSSDWRALP